MSSGKPCTTGMEAADPAGMVRARRERGDHRFDPVRFHFIEALAARASVHHGEARRILDDKVVKLLAVYGEDLAKARRADGPSAPPAADAKQEGRLDRGALAELVDDIDRRASARESGATASDGTPSLASHPELKTLRYFRSTWSRLSAERRLLQSLAKVPENAGPLNSHQLVHRSLILMRDLSPEYLNRFMSYVDVLHWLDQADAGRGLSGTHAPRAESHRKTARGRSG
ncbi:DUF2894 domain-containing protein [Variovorax sp. SRS16]|uniref:DUF2894 domain-containing protein n=1 Tax=Variovorax sp. SRS16 TaxID=282217 RepID=UPI002F966703